MRDDIVGIWYIRVDDEGDSRLFASPKSSWDKMVSKSPSLRVPVSTRHIPYEPYRAGASAHKLRMIKRLRTAEDVLEDVRT